MSRVHVTDHAVLGYRAAAHDLDITAVKRHIAGLAVTAEALGAIGVTVENVKLVLDHATVERVIKPRRPACWPTRAIKPGDD